MRSLQIVATSSNAGKSLILAGMARLLFRLGYSVAPFKAQNMALNAAITPDGYEIGRAQAMQAEAAGIPAEVEMNPILLKPEADHRSQLIVLGEVAGQVDAHYWREGKRAYWPVVRKALRHLQSRFDCVLLEGAGGATEINLDLYDFVNLGLALDQHIPALLVGDIDRGGVFASLYGSHKLLPEDLQNTVIAYLINKFRGDRSLLEGGLDRLTAELGIPSAGILSYVEHGLDDEDSLSDRLLQKGPARHLDHLQIVIPRFPRMANFTDFTVLEAYPDLEIRYIDRREDLESADLIILAGSKSVRSDLAFLRERGLDQAILESARAGIPVWGICGGYQMLGEGLEDPLGIEGDSVTYHPALGLLPVVTCYSREKIRGCFQDRTLLSSGLGQQAISGYMLHQGQTRLCREGQGEPLFEGGGAQLGWASGLIRGAYYHGLFDQGSVAEDLLNGVAKLAESRGRSLKRRSWTGTVLQSYRSRREASYDRLARMLAQDIQWDILLPRWIDDPVERKDFETRLAAYINSSDDLIR